MAFSLSTGQKVSCIKTSRLITTPHCRTARRPRRSSRTGSTPSAVSPARPRAGSTRPPRPTSASTPGMSTSSTWTSPRGRTSPPPSASRTSPGTRRGTPPSPGQQSSYTFVSKERQYRVSIGIFKIVALVFLTGHIHVCTEMSE